MLRNVAAEKKVTLQRGISLEVIQNFGGLQLKGMATVGDSACVCSACVKVRATLVKIFRVLDLYRWLTDAYIVDFYRENLWDKLPGSWTIFLDTVSPIELGKWLSRESQCNRVWPLSLLSLQRVIDILNISRNHEVRITVECQKHLQNSNNIHDIRNWNAPIAGAIKRENAYASAVSHAKLKNLFTKHVKLKKRHEIDKIADIAADCASLVNCECVVDIGAGIGHLARLLAYKYGLCVMCIEQQSTLTEQARKCDDQLEATIRKHLPNFKSRRPQHVSEKIDSSKCIGTELVDYLKKRFRENFTLDRSTQGFGLIGLHPCGDLATTLLKFYAEQDEAKFICIAGCCYMKLTLEDTKENSKGYPLSKYVLATEKHKLSYTALEVACHAIENYCDRLKTGKYDDLMVHAYRAELESLLVQKNAKLYHVQLKSVKISENMTFEQYCTAATKNLKPEDQLNEFDLANPQIINHLTNWKRVVAFGSLRVMLAPLIETAVLLDRYLFLSERSLCPKLVPEFDPRLSPRNFVLISMK